MERFKLFISNFLVYGLGGMISKIIPLLMLPIITRLMPDTAYFGLNDISTIIISFGSAIALMGMYDAMFRLFFDKEEDSYQESICSSALCFTILTSVFVFLILILFRKYWAKAFFGSIEYQNLLVISAMSVLIGSTNSIVSAPTRIKNQRKIYLTANFLSPVLSYSIAIPLLLKGWYVMALPLSSVIAALSLELFFGILNRKWFSFRLVRWGYIKQMLLIAIPLMPNFLIYWVLNSSNRLMIAKIMGNEYVGMYAIGGKIGMLSQLIYSAFAGGWQYFAFSTMKDKDQVQMTSRIFEYLGVLSMGAGIIMASASEFVFKILFTGEYINGSIVAPYLFLAPLLLMLYQIGSNQFLVIKKTWPSLCIISGGAVANVALSLLLIPALGIEGAAIATLVGYIFAVGVCVIVLQRMNLLKLDVRFMVVVLISIAYFLIWRKFLISYSGLAISGAVIANLIYIYIYYSDIKNLFVYCQKAMKRG